PAASQRKSQSESTQCSSLVQQPLHIHKGPPQLADVLTPPDHERESHESHTHTGDVALTSSKVDELESHVRAQSAVHKPQSHILGVIVFYSNCPDGNQCCNHHNCTANSTNPRKRRAECDVTTNQQNKQLVDDVSRLHACFKGIDPVVPVYNSHSHAPVSRRGRLSAP